MPVRTFIEGWREAAQAQGYFEQFDAQEQTPNRYTNLMRNSYMVVCETKRAKLGHSAYNNKLLTLLVVLIISGVAILIGIRIAAEFKGHERAWNDTKDFFNNPLVQGSAIGVGAVGTIWFFGNGAWKHIIDFFAKPAGSGAPSHKREEKKHAATNDDGEDETTPGAPRPAPRVAMTVASPPGIPARPDTVYTLPNVFDSNGKPTQGEIEPDLE